MDEAIQKALAAARSGSSESREWLISKNRPFILKAASNICKRHIDWTNDEASICLIAFNEAIDRFRDDEGKSFHNYAYLLMRSRLIDSFRKEKRINEAEGFSLNETDEFELSSAEVASALELHQQVTSQDELASELIRFDETLQEYGIDLEELEECSPEHKDARIHLIRIAKTFSQYPMLIEYMLRTKKLPIKEMLQHVSVSRKTLERNRKYLIALILIYNSDDFTRIRGNISFADLGE